MEKEGKHRISLVNSISNMEADTRKARTVSRIMEKAERGDEEENKGRS